MNHKKRGHFYAHKRDANFELYSRLFFSALAGSGFEFGGEALISLLFHPRVEFLLQRVHAGAVLRVGGEVVHLVGVGLQVVELFGWAVVVTRDFFRGGGVGLGGFDP